MTEYTIADAKLELDQFSDLVGDAFADKVAEIAAKLDIAADGNFRGNGA